MRWSARSRAVASRELYDLVASVIGSGTPVLQRFGVSDDEAVAVGLTCGGVLDAYVERVDPATSPELAELAADIEAVRPVAVATVVEHADPGRVGPLTYGPDGEQRGEGMRVFASVFAPPPRMVILGALDFAAGLAKRGAPSATGSRSATHARSSPRPPASRTPTWSSSPGRTLTCVARSRPAPSTTGRS